MKKKKNKGFTLVELLAAMGILGLIMALVVPNILKINDNNLKQGYVTDANKLIDLAKYDIAKNIEDRPSSENNHCTILGLAYLDNSEFDNPPMGGCYDVNRSFVVVKYLNHEYHYYVRLVEVYKDKDTDSIKYYGVGLSTVQAELDDNGNNEITKDAVELECDNVEKFDYTSNDINFTISNDITLDKIILNYNGNVYKSYDDTKEGLCVN